MNHSYHYKALQYHSLVLFTSNLCEVRKFSHIKWTSEIQIPIHAKNPPDKTCHMYLLVILLVLLIWVDELHGACAILGAGDAVDRVVQYLLFFRLNCWCFPN